MRRLLTCAALAASLLVVPAAASAFTYTSLLEAQANPGSCGGSVGCGVNNDQTVYDPAANAVVTAAQADNRFGNTTYATALVTFGTAKVFANAYATTGYAETRAYTDTQDIIPASQIMGGVYTMNFNIAGGFTDTTGIQGASAYSYLYVDAVDNTTNNGLGSLNWFSTVAQPNGLVVFSVNVPTGHSVRLRVSFEADAYTSSFNFGAVNGPLYVQSDYSHSLDYYITGPAGSPALIGASGHDYSINPLAGVPEPASWAMMLLGLSAAGAGLRRRRAAVTSA